MNIFSWISMRRVFFIVFILLLMPLVACTAGGGATDALDSNDGSVDEWANVPVLITDPQGDAAPPDVDIVEIKVSSSPLSGEAEDLFFLMKVAGNPALQGQYTSAIASIDCDNNGIDQEPQDRLVIYVASEDHMYVFRGDQSEGFTVNKNSGQAIGEYIEWKVTIDDLPPDDKDGVDCKGNVKIRFATADISEYYASAPGEQVSVAKIIDDAGPLIDWTIR